MLWRSIGEAMFNSQDICCFFTKEQFSHTNHTIIIGYGFNLTKHRSGSIQDIVIIPDYLSHLGYQAGVRRSVWNDPFNYFLPLALNKQHFNRSLGVLRTAIESSMGTLSVGNLYMFLSAAMNSIVVKLFKTCTQGRPLKHASQVALEQYCHLHHLLMHCSLHFPDIRKVARRNIDSFLQAETSRHKRATPDLGHFLINLLPTGFGWTQDGFNYAFLKEMLARNVMWNFRKDGRLKNNNLNKTLRAEWTFEACKVSLQLTAFQHWFIANVGKGTASGPEELVQRYDDRVGKPSRLQLDRIQEVSKSVLGLGRWSDFFHIIETNVAGPDQLHTILVNAMALSKKKKYT